MEVLDKEVNCAMAGVFGACVLVTLGAQLPVGYVTSRVSPMPSRGFAEAVGLQGHCRSWQLWSWSLLLLSTARDLHSETALATPTLGTPEQDGALNVLRCR